MERGGRKRAGHWQRKRGPQGKGKKFAYPQKQKKWQIEVEEMKSLTARIPNIDTSVVTSFTDFPLSKKTLEGLQESKFSTPTDIQKETIGLGLQGRDILGAAKTGSGKTLAFVVPILERLYHKKWSSGDGLGALVISPTRELAYQTFEVLRKVGKFHDFSAGLVIGGKNVQDEAERINQTNIVICTPGRLLQHMDETALFAADNLQVLVLDEADRILDLGFAQTMNGVIENLPTQRQTLLFSATQTKSVKDLARLSLQRPVYVSVHEKAVDSTPTQLRQSYIVCELSDKHNLLWSFIKQHLHKKILVFMATCKQVRFAFESFRRLRPGMTLLELHGGMKQMKRVEVYQQFCRKQHAVLLATDIAARGLDFPAVHWVLQLDCPEDANTYIHRAGRTARYESDGEALLVLTPSEETAMLANINEKKIPIERIRVNPRKLWSIQQRLESFCAADVTLKQYAQAAFMAYLKYVFYQKDKSVFDVNKLDTETFASALGLAVIPKVRFLQKQQKLLDQKKKQKKEEDGLAILKRAMMKVSGKGGDEEAPPEESGRDDTASGGESDSSGEDDESAGSEDESDDNQHEGWSSAEENDSGQEETGDEDVEEEEEEVSNETDFDDGEDTLFKVKSRFIPEPEIEESPSTKETENASRKPQKIKASKAALAKKLLKKNIVVNTKVTFDDEGDEIVDPHKKRKVDALASEEEDADEGGINISDAREKLKQEDVHDKALFRQKVKDKHREKRLKEKEKRRKAQQGDEGEDDEMEVQLGSVDGEDGGVSDEENDKSGLHRSSGDDDDGDGEGEYDDDEGDDDDDEGDDDDEDDSSSDDEDVSPAKRFRKHDIDVSEGTGLTLEDDEAMALRLLGNI